MPPKNNKFASCNTLATQLPLNPPHFAWKMIHYSVGISLKFLSNIPRISPDFLQLP